MFSTLYSLITTFFYIGGSNKKVLQIITSQKTRRKKVSQSPSSRVFPQPQNIHFFRLSVWVSVPLFAKYPGLVNDLQISPAALSLTHTRSDIIMHPLNTQQLDGVAPVVADLVRCNSINRQNQPIHQTF